MKRPALLQDRTVEISLGAVLFVTSAWLFYDAYEGRGRRRPFVTRILPVP